MIQRKVGCHVACYVLEMGKAHPCGCKRKVQLPLLRSGEPEGTRLKEKTTTQVRIKNKSGHKSSRVRFLHELKKTRIFFLFFSELASSMTPSTV